MHVGGIWCFDIRVHVQCWNQLNISISSNTGHFFCVCVSMCRYMCIGCMHGCSHVHREKRLTLMSPLSLLLPYVFETRASWTCCSSLIGQMSYPLSSEDPPVSTSPALGLHAYPTMLWFLYRCWGSKLKSSCFPDTAVSNNIIYLYGENTLNPFSRFSKCIIHCYYL